MRPIIMPATNTATMTKISMLMKPTPTPPKMLLSHMPTSGIRPPSGVIESCIALTDPFDVTVVVDRPERREAGAEADLLAFHRAGGLVDAHRRDRRVAAELPARRRTTTIGM